MEMYCLKVGEGREAELGSFSAPTPVHAAQLAVDFAAGRAFEVWRGNVRLFAVAGRP